MREPYHVVSGKPSFLRRLWSPEAAFFLGLWLVLMVAGRSRMFRDPGTFWHVAVGQRMLDTGELVREDPFSFTAHGKPWISQYWPCEIAMAALYRIGGWDVLLVVTVTILAAMYAWVAGRLHRSGLLFMCVVLAVVLALAASSPQFHVRPLILTIVLLALTFALLVDVEGGRASTGRLWWLVPLFVVWANVHGGVLGGLGTVALACAGWLCAPLAGWDSPARTWRQRLELAALPVACTAALLVNPYGWELPKLWLSILALPLPEIIEEHGPLVGAGGSGWTTAVFGAVYLAALAGFPLFLRKKEGAAFAEPKTTLADWPALTRPRVVWLIPLVWLALAWMRIRQGPLFAVTALLAMADLLPHTRWARLLARRGYFRFPRSAAAVLPGTARWPSLLVPAAVVGAALMVTVFRGPSSTPGGGWVRFDPTYWPTELLPELREISDGPQRARIFNDMLYGGFLIFHTPRLEVFIDDRCELYGREFLAAYVNALQNDPSQLDRWADQYGFEYALVGTNTVFDRYLESSPQWVRAKETAAGSLYRTLPVALQRRSP